MLSRKSLEVLVERHLCSVTAHGPPCLWPVLARVDHGSNRPVGPRCRLALHAIDARDEPFQGRLVSIPLSRAPGHIVQLRDAVCAAASTRAAVV